MTQGESLDMIVHDIGILQLMKKPKKEFPDVTQPWYADDAGALSTFERIKSYFHLIELHGLGQGYDSDP